MTKNFSRFFFKKGTLFESGMETFSKEMLRLGTLRGFVHFTCYLRGREELLVTIKRSSEEASVRFPVFGCKRSSFIRKIIMYHITRV